MSKSTKSETENWWQQKKCYISKAVIGSLTSSNDKSFNTMEKTNESKPMLSCSVGLLIYSVLHSTIFNYKEFK